VDDFASLDTPEGPGDVKVVELFAFEKYFSCFGMVVPPAFIKMLSNVSFKSMAIKKWAFWVQIATISSLSKESSL
jgi:hypothetical protein